MYDGTHSISFLPDQSGGTKINTWTDWFLIPDSRPDVSSPGIDAKYVTIPGRHGAIDMTDYLTGEPIYANRTGSWSFLIDNDHEDWYSLRGKIIGFLHGRRMICILEDEPDWYYIGRFTVEPKSGSSNSTITINYTLEPFRYRQSGSDTDWLWDPFNFDEDRIEDGKIASL